MTDTNLLTVMISKMKSDPTISSQVGTHVAVRETPAVRVAKQITLRKSYGRSNSILHATNCSVYVTVWVKNKDVTEPFKSCSTIVNAVISLFNRKGETTLNSGTLVVNQLVKTDADISYDDGNEYWTGVIIFEAVHNE